MTEYYDINGDPVPEECDALDCADCHARSWCRYAVDPYGEDADAAREAAREAAKSR